MVFLEESVLYRFGHATGMTMAVLVSLSKSNTSRGVRVHGQLSVPKQRLHQQAMSNSRLPSIKRLTTCISASCRFKMRIAYCLTISSSRAIPSDWTPPSIPFYCIPIRPPVWCISKGVVPLKRFSFIRLTGNWLMSASAQKPFQSETSTQGFIWSKSTLQVNW